MFCKEMKNHIKYFITGRMGMPYMIPDYLSLMRMDSEKITAEAMKELK